MVAVLAERVSLSTWSLKMTSVHSETSRPSTIQPWRKCQWTLLISSKTPASFFLSNSNPHPFSRNSLTNQVLLYSEGVLFHKSSVSATSLNYSEWIIDIPKAHLILPFLSGAIYWSWSIAGLICMYGVNVLTGIWIENMPCFSWWCWFNHVWDVSLHWIFLSVTQGKGVKYKTIDVFYMGYLDSYSKSSSLPSFFYRSI